MKRITFRLLYTLFVATLTIGVMVGYKEFKRYAYKKQLLSNLNWAKKVPLEKIKEQKAFVVTIPSYRNEEYCEKNLRSVFEQKYDNYRVIYVDDASPDNTYEKVKEIVTKFDQWHRFTLLKNEKNRGAMFNHVQMSQYYRDDEIVVNLDGDDFFASDEILQNLNAYYANPDVWATYGQYITYPEYEIGRCKPMTFSDLKKGNVRDLPWVTSALRTFYGGLFRGINIEDFLYEGSFLPMACDLAYMYPVVERAREHAYFTPDVAYIYNRATGINDDKKSRSKQVYFELFVRSGDRYEGLKTHPSLISESSSLKKIDVAIFGKNRPVELFATLESLSPYQEEIGEISVFYYGADSKIKMAYDRLKGEFPHVHFIPRVIQESEFCKAGAQDFDQAELPAKQARYTLQDKEALLKMLDQPTSDHLLVLSEGTVFNRDVHFKEAVQDLEKLGVTSYSFHADKNASKEYQQIIPLRGLREGLYGIAFSPNDRVNFEKNSLSYAAIYRKNRIKKWLQDSPCFSDFEQKWAAHHQGKSSIVICNEKPMVAHIYELTNQSKEFFANVAFERFISGKSYDDCLLASL